MLKVLSPYTIIFSRTACCLRVKSTLYFVDQVRGRRWRGAVLKRLNGVEEAQVQDIGVGLFGGWLMSLISKPPACGERHACITSFMLCEGALSCCIQTSRPAHPEGRSLLMSGITLPMITFQYLSFVTSTHTVSILPGGLLRLPRCASRSSVNG